MPSILVLPRTALFWIEPLVFFELLVFLWTQRRTRKDVDGKGNSGPSGNWNTPGRNWESDSNRFHQQHLRSLSMHIYI